MAGITAFGAYIPINRLQRRQFGGGAGERAVAGHDEDSITMAVAAGFDCLGTDGGDLPDLLYFASTTAAYREKQAAAIVAEALDLGEHVRSADFGDSLRAGAAAMLAALDAVQAGGARAALVTVADSRLGAPGGANEANGGDAAAALLFGTENVIAEVTATHSITADFTGSWRSPAARFVSSWEERFVIGEGYAPLVSAAVNQVLGQAGLTPGDCARLVLYSPSPRHHAALADSLGFLPEQVQDPLFAAVGSPGAAHAPLLLAAALAEAAPGDRILFAAFGEGADAILFTVTAEIGKRAPGRGVAGYLEQRRPISYQSYARWRRLVPFEPPRRPARARPSQPAAWRNRRQNLAMYGVRCSVCGTPQYPPQRICVRCRTKDQLEPYRFADRHGRIVTFTQDYLTAAVDPPTLMALVDFKGGGRALLEVTDCEPAAIAIGMEVEMSFRHLAEVDGLHVYYWKARPQA